MHRRRKAFQKEIGKLAEQGVTMTADVYKNLCVQFGLPFLDDDDS